MATNAQTEKSQAPQTVEVDEFAGLLNKQFKPKTSSNGLSSSAA